MDDNQAWLLRRILDEAKIMAPCDGPDDKRLQALVSSYLLTHSDCAYGNNYYSLTPRGRRSFGVIK